MNGTTAYALSKQYVADTADSLGSLKGAPCTIKSQTETDDSYIVTFEWTGTSGAKETSQLTIKKPKDGVDGTNGTNGKDGTDGIGISKIEKIGTVDLVDTYRITFTDGSTFDYEVKNGKDGQGGGTVDAPIESISVNGVNVPVDENKNVDITVPEAYDDTDIRAELANKADTDHTHTTVNGHTVESDVPVDAKFTDTVYNDTQVKTQIQSVANGLMDSVGYSADYKTIDIIAKNGVKKSVNVAPIISHASITELSDVDTTNKATGKALVYNAITNKHEYADVSGTDEKVKMDASTDAKYLGELLDNVTIVNENGELKVKKLDGQEVTITEINYLKGLTMNVMDLVNMFANGGVKIINTPVATYAELLTIDKSAFIEGISYLVYVLTDENHDNAKTTYLVDKDSEIPTYFGFADSQRDFTTNPIDLATEITGKLGISNMDSDAIKALFTVDGTYKTETATNNAFSTHGAKALYDELLLVIGNKANDSDLTAHKDDTDIHVSTEDRTKWDSAKTHADSVHAPSNAQENVLETVKVNGTALTPSSKAVNIDLTDYAKKTDIPTTLPANGGNSDTVNNHTVKSDVPENAVFTDTIYDDTEVKESIEELNSNLTQLEYSDVAGSRNIFQLEKRKCGSMVGNDLVLAHQVGEFYEYDWKPNTQYTISFVGRNSTSNGRQRLYFKYTDGSDGEAITNYETSFAYVSVTSEAGKTIKSINSYWGADGSLIIKDAEIMIEEGTKATPYEPYIPSVKMLAEENAQQNTEAMDLKMLGWTVPSECPVQNYVDGDGIFHQRVDRIDLGSMVWIYQENQNRFHSNYLINLIKGVQGNEPFNGYNSKYEIVSFNNSKDKTIYIDNYKYLFVRDSNYTDLQSFNNAIKGIYLYYELETENTIGVASEVVTKLKNDLGGMSLSASGTTLTITNGVNTWTLNANS